MLLHKSSEQIQGTPSMFALVSVMSWYWESCHIWNVTWTTAAASVIGLFSQSFFIASEHTTLFFKLWTKILLPIGNEFRSLKNTWRFWIYSMRQFDCKVRPDWNLWRDSLNVATWDELTMKRVSYTSWCDASHIILSCY